MALRIGAELGRFALAGLAGLGEIEQDLVGVIDRRRHELRRLVAGVAEHDALVARAFLLIGRLLGVDAGGDVGRLTVQQDLDIGVGPVEAFLLVADVADGVAGQLLDHLHGDAARAARFAGDDHPVGGRHGLAGGADDPGIETLLCASR